MTNKIKDFILNSFFVRKAYSAKAYVDIAISEISWVTGKLPEIGGLIIILNYLNIKIIPLNLGIFLFLFSLLLLFFGYFLKKTGLYDVEIYSRVQRDPVSSEILEAARLIIEDHKNAKKNRQ